MHMKACSTSLVIREKQIKPQRVTTIHPLEWVKSKRLSTKCWQDCGDIGTIIIDCLKIQNGITTLVNSLAFSYKHLFTIRSKYPTCRYLLQENKTYVYTRTCMQISIAVLFVIAQNWKQYKCPLPSVLIITIYDTAIKKITDMEQYR